MVDDEGDLTDIQLPEDNTDGHVSLLVVEWFAEHARNSPGEAIHISAIEQYVAGLIGIYGSQWRREVREAGAEVRLTEQVLLRLRALRLIQFTPGGVIPSPACGRYAVLDRIDPGRREE
jgi:uncharacterized protein (TIGR02678 family)